MFDFGVRLLKQKLKFEGFRFKEHPETQITTALQILFSHGFASPVMLVDGETDEDMQTLRLKPGQTLTRWEWHCEGETLRRLFYCQDGSLFAEFKAYNPDNDHEVDKQDIDANIIIGWLCKHEYADGKSDILFGVTIDCNHPYFLR